jgi:hypothetical protein
VIKFYIAYSRTLSEHLAESVPESRLRSESLSRPGKTDPRLAGADFRGDGMNRQGADDRMLRDQPIARRSLLKGVGAGTLAVGTGGFLSACSSGIKGAGGPAKTGTITIGFVTPLTGPLAGFASGDQYVLSQIRKSSPYQKGFKVGGTTYKVSIVVQDSQSDPNRASAVARQLILQNKVDMILTTSTPETTNPVAGACEKLGTPCLSTVCPWQPGEADHDLQVLHLVLFRAEGVPGLLCADVEPIQDRQGGGVPVPERFRRQRFPRRLRAADQGIRLQGRGRRRLPGRHD